jgi:hypothetical protein
MATFLELLTAPAERLVNFFYTGAADQSATRQQKLKRIGSRQGLHPDQVICGLGFNPAIADLPDVLNALGFPAYEDLANERNSLFISDIYHHLSIDDILAIYQAVRQQPQIIDVMQYLLTSRLDHIEQRIEATVNPFVIERYKKEMRTIYSDGIAQIDFAEARLSNTHSGFRALINEVAIIIDAKLIPVGDIFFRDTILPEEKRKILSRGMVPIELVRSRLEDAAISPQERRMLEDYLRLNKG